MPSSHHERMARRKRRGGKYAAPIQWHTTDAGRQRLELDLTVLKEEFSSLTFSVEDDGTAKLEGPVSVSIGNRYGIIRTAEAIIAFEADYPKSEPIGYVQKDTFKPHPGKTMKDRHMSEGGWCCLNLPGTSSWDPSDEDGLRKWLTNFVLFVHRQFLYDINGGKWLGPEWEHGTRGWAQFVRLHLDRRYWQILVDIARAVPGLRRRPCPCGSGKPLAGCHKRSVDAFLRRLPHDPELHSEVATLMEAYLKERVSVETGVIENVASDTLPSSETSHLSKLSAI